MKKKATSLLFLKSWIGYITVASIISLLFDFFREGEIYLSLATLMKHIIIGLFWSLIMIPLSLRWKKYYENKKP